MYSKEGDICQFVIAADIVKQRLGHCHLMQRKQFESLHQFEVGEVDDYIEKNERGETIVHCYLRALRRFVAPISRLPCAEKMVTIT